MTDTYTDVLIKLLEQREPIFFITSVILFQGPLPKIQKATISFVVFLRLSVRMGELASQSMDSEEI
jgi:hypothetical protein